MNKLSAFAALAATAAVLLAGLAAPTSAQAGEGTSMGHGVKCYWVLVSTVGNVNTYQQVCRKGI